MHRGTTYFVEVLESGSDKDRLLQATTYLKPRHDRATFNAPWARWLPEGCAPARVCISTEMARPAYLQDIATHPCPSEGL